MGFTELYRRCEHNFPTERSLEKGPGVVQVMAKSMLVIMVRGLNSGLQFPYAHSYHVVLFEVMKCSQGQI